MKYGLEKYIAIGILIMVSAVVMYTIYYSKYAFEIDVDKKPKTLDTGLVIAFSTSPLCTEGSNTSCKSGNCDGVRLCKNGQWTECYVIKKCVAGAKISCGEHGCAEGYKTCNECGTEYGECVEKPD